MIDPKIFDEFSRKLSSFLPAGMTELKNDFEKNARASMQSLFVKMDLVTREEFDVQAGVLQRTREKLEVLEKNLAALEARMQAPEAKNPNLPDV